MTYDPQQTKRTFFFYGDWEDFHSVRPMMDQITDITRISETDAGPSGRVAKVEITVAKPEEYEGNINNLREEETHGGN